MSDSLSTVIQLTALPLDADIAFTLAEGPIGLKSNERIQGSDYVISEMMKNVSDSELFLGLINHGNFIEIAAELKRLDDDRVTPEIQRWREIAFKVLMLQEGFFFRILRAQILSPFSSGDSNRAELINDCKAQMINTVGGPPVSISEISWDAVSYKIPMSTAEYLLQTFTGLQGQLTPGQLAVLDSIEEQCRQQIEMKCADFRVRTNSIADEFVSDLCVYLETKINGGADPGRQDRIESIGKAGLIEYVDKMQSLFAVGHLPGVIAPAKIFACQDIKSLTDLRSSILSLAQLQIQDLTGQHPDSMRPVEFAAVQENGLLNDPREPQKGTMSGIQRTLNATLGEKELPNAKDSQKWSGGGNSLAQQVDLTSGDIVLNMDEKQDFQLHQQLSLLLACVRTRLNAVQDSAFELASKEDFDNLEIVKVLSKATTPTITDDLFQTASALQELFETGHNVMKFKDKALPDELIQYLDYCIEGNLNTMLKAVPQILKQADILGKYKKYLLATMAQKSRLQCEVQERLRQRIAVSMAFD